MTESSKALSPFKKIEEPNIIIHLNGTHHIEGLYGSKKPFDILLINVDENDYFIEQVQQLISELP